LQNSLIFLGTIRDNIKIGKINVFEEDVIHAGKVANLYDFITALPKGFGTEVGERGVKLSAGECQRLAIARVILKDSQVLIFDEATCQIDSDSDRLIQEATQQILGRNGVKSLQADRE
jgi:ABC-type multidrug transport system fused ATPase/permease subunit